MLTPLPNEQQPLLHGRYRCVRLLKTGGGVATYEAVDLGADAAPVVVKVVDATAVAPAVVMRLEHEAAVLARLDAASFCPLLGFAREDDVLILVQPLLAGQNLADRLLRGPLSVMDTLVVAADVLRALQQAHDLGVLHRDVKPANVLARGEDNVEGAALIDFGLARSSSLDPELRDQAVGTARYLSPEQAGLVETPVDERSDLYSLGVVLYESLTGRPPFEGDTVGLVLRQHLNQAPPPIRGTSVSVPRVVEGFVTKLLGKDPAERYQSAAGALADVELIEMELRRGVTEPTVVLGLGDRRSVLTEPSFVGRRAELESLTHALRRARGGHAGLALVDAESGGGKSRLIDEFAHRTEATNTWIVRGQGVDQAGQRPYQLLEGVAAAIRTAAVADPSLQARLALALEDHADALAAALPELESLVDRSRAEVLPEAHGDLRSLAALAALLNALGTPERPALIILDDCQWADGLTLKLLSQWFAAARTTECHALLVVAFRSEEVGEDHPLRTIDDALRLTLRPLTLEETRDVIHSMAGPVPEEVVKAVAQLSEGSPFMATAVLRGLVEAGALVDAVGGWTVEADALAAAQTSRRAALFLVRRLELLTPTALDLLAVGAVLGKEFDLVLAADLAGQKPSVVMPALDQAKRRRILWVDEESGVCRFLHDKLREALLSRLDAAERTSLHRSAALRIEQLDASRVFDLAYHYDAAGVPERALPYALIGAEMSRSAHTLDIAETHYRLAERSLDEADDATRLRVAEGLGDVLNLRGAYDEALLEYERALRLAPDVMAQAALHGKVGEVAFKCGAMDDASRSLEGALRLLGERVPRSTFGFTLALLHEVVVQFVHCVAPRTMHRRSLQGAEKTLLAARIFSRLAYTYWFGSGRIRCGWAHLHEMNLLEKYPPTSELAQAYSEHAPVMTMVPWYGRGIAYLTKSLEIRTDLGDVWGQGQTLGFHGVTAYAASRYREAIDACRKSARLLERTGDKWEMDTALWNIALSQYRLGELRQSVHTAQQLYTAATDIGDMTAAGTALSAWTLAAEGKIDADLLHAELGRETGDAATRVQVHVAEAVRQLASGDTHGAGHTLKVAAKIVKTNGLRQEYVAPVQPWLATTLRMRLEAASPYDDHRALTREARRTASRALWVARSYKNNLPHALREKALIAALHRKPRRARRLLDRSLVVARGQGARFEEALTLQALGRLGRELGWIDAADNLTTAGALLAELRPTEERGTNPDETLSLADRFTTVLEVGRLIAAAATSAAVYAAVNQAAVALLRGEQCHVLDLSAPGEEITTLSGEVIDSVSRTLVVEAAKTGLPVVSSPTEGLEVTESIVLSGARSVLCAPIMIEGEAVAAFYVTHAQLGGLFGGEELQLASFITTLAAATLEHVAGTEARFRSLVQHSSDVITVVGADGHITFQGPSIERVFGFAPTHLLNQHLRSWLHPDDAAAVFTAIELNRRGAAGIAVIECRLQRRDGSWCACETTLTNLSDDENVRGVVLNTRDVTERKQNEERLAAAVDAALEASRLKSAFLANMSHEIRTPMNGVVGMVDLLRSTPLNEDQLDYIDAMAQSAESLVAIIDDVLDLSKIEAGKLSIENADYNLRALIDATVAPLQPAASDRGVTLSGNIDSRVPVAINGDRMRVRQVINNLLSNAIKFTPVGGVNLEVSLQHEMMRFEVRDTGIGIPKDASEHLFEPFVQADASTTRRYGGTGLGLAISKQLVDLMGGDIGVTSEVGIGSTFWFTLPLVPAAPGAIPVPAAPMVATGDLQVGGKILVVEDNAVNRKVAVGILRNLGYDADVAADGIEAVEALQHARYDAVLMDCQMPRMDGYDATRAIRSLENGERHTPIIAMTASAMASDRAACLDAGMDDFLSKPIARDALASTLAEAITSFGPTGVGTSEIRRSDRFDDELVEGLRAMDEDGTFLHELIDLFRSATAQDMRSLREAVAQGDASAMKTTAHRAKGASRNLGLRALSASLNAIEVCAAAPPEVVADALTVVEDDLAAALDYLQHLRAS